MIGKKISRHKIIEKLGEGSMGVVYKAHYTKLVRNGKIGKVSVARAAWVDNMYPNGIGKMKPENPPVGFDWDRWLGLREYRPYQINIAPYKFRWWKSYSSQNGNYGIHYIDAMRLLINEEAPKSINAVALNSIIEDDRTIPDISQISFEFESGSIMTWEHYETASG